MICSLEWLQRSRCWPRDQTPTAGARNTQTISCLRPSFLGSWNTLNWIWTKVSCRIMVPVASELGYGLHLGTIVCKFDIIISYIYIGVRDLPLQDMISLGAWRMGLDALGKLFRRRRPPGFGKWAVIGFHYDFGASGVRGAIRLVFRVPKVILKTFKCRKHNQMSKKSRTQIHIYIYIYKNGQKQQSIINPL